jgi:polyisoprenoid-binding protein YceI
MMRIFAGLSAAVLIATAVPPAQKPPALGPTQWQVDPAHSSANFSVRHLMVTTVRGTLGPVNGMIEYDGKDVRSIKADIVIDVKGITTQNASRDEDLRSDHFFDVAHHPTIKFKSKRIEAGSGGAFKMVGDLTIRGTTKEVVLDVEPPAPIGKGMRYPLITGSTATTKIKRFDFGLKYNEMVEATPVVGDEVTITIDLEVGRLTPPGTAH